MVWGRFGFKNQNHALEGRLTRKPLLSLYWHRGYVATIMYSIGQEDLIMDLGMPVQTLTRQSYVRGLKKQVLF